MKYWYYVLWFLLIFTSFEGLGLRNPSWGGLGYSNLGWYGTLQLFTLVLSLCIPFLYKPRFFFNRKNIMGLPAKLVFLLLPLIVLQSFIILLFSNEVTLTEILTNLVKMKYVVYYFIFVYLLSRPNGISIGINSMIASALIASLIVFYFVLSGHTTEAIKLSTSDISGREFRIILPSAMLISFGFFYFFSILKLKKNFLVIIGIILTFGAALLQMHRSVIIALILTTVFALFKLYGIKGRNILYIIAVIGIIAFGITIVFKTTEYSIDKIILSFFNTAEEIKSKTGNFGVRFYLPINSFKHVLNNYLILGVGLNWETINNVTSYISMDKYYATPTYDSAFNNIIVVYGLVGILVYVFLFKRLFSSLIQIINKTNDKYRKSICFTVLFTLVYSLLTGTSSDTFIIQNSAFIFTLNIALAYSLNKKEFNSNNEKNYTQA